MDAPFESMTLATAPLLDIVDRNIAKHGMMFSADIVADIAGWGSVAER